MNTIIKDIRDSGKKKWLLLIPFLLIIGLIYVTTWAENTIEQLMFQEKCVEAQDMINTFCAMAEKTTDQMPESFWSDTLRIGIERFDELPFVYGALFTIQGDGLKLLSYRTIESEGYVTPFDASAFPSFLELVATQKSGHIILPVDHTQLGLHEMYVYFKHVPAPSKNNEQDYVLVSGVSKYSVITEIPKILVISEWAMLIVLMLTIFFMFYVMIRQMTRTEKIKKTFIEYMQRKGES